MVLLISYDLNGHERPSAYAAVEKMIKDNAKSTRKPLYSQWFVETDESVQAWHERMKTVADANDSWFILPVGTSRQGWLNPEIWDWLNARA